MAAENPIAIIPIMEKESSIENFCGLALKK